MTKYPVEAVPAASLAHRDSATIPDKARLMLSELHRIGCTGRACSSPVDRGGQVRATWYARRQQEHEGKHVTIVTYLCHDCARVFARTHDVSMVVPRA